MRAIVLLCEGKHDVAFLYRILKVLGFRSDMKRTIDEMPVPLNRYFKEQFKGHKYGEFNLDGVRPILPQRILRREDLLILLYGIEGDSQYERTRSVIGDYILYSSEQDLFPVKTGTERIRHISFLFFTDADDKGIEQREKMLIDEYGGILSDLETLCHKSVLQNRDHLVGCYIFSDGTGTGKLEHLTLPLFRQGHEALFDDIEIFWETYFEKTTKKARKHRLKSLIGIAGQLHEPGSSNEVIIRQSEYITDEKIKNDPACIEIIGFLESVFCSIPRST